MIELTMRNNHKGTEITDREHRVKKSNKIFFKTIYSVYSLVSVAYLGGYYANLFIVFRL